MYDTTGHRECGNTCGTNHGIDLLFGEEVDQLCKQNAACGVENEGEETQDDDEEGLPAQEELGLHLGSDGETQEEGDKVGQHLLGGLGEAVQHAALADEVTEHEEADQGRALGGDQTRDDGDDDGEQDICKIDNLPQKLSIIRAYNGF